MDLGNVQGSPESKAGKLTESQKGASMGKKKASLIYANELNALKDNANKRAKAEQLEFLSRRVKQFEQVAQREEMKAKLAGGDIDTANDKYIQAIEAKLKILE